MEYYFSDSNLIYDKFMQNQLKNNSKNYISLNTFLRFNKISQMLSSFSNIKQVQLKLLKTAIKNSSILNLDESHHRVSRIKPWSLNLHQIEQFKEVKRRKTIYVENLNKNFRQNDVFRIFKDIGQVKSIEMNKNHKGYCFVEFSSAEQAQKALELNNKIPEVLMEISKGRISALTVMSYFQWRNFKNKLIEVMKDHSRKSHSKDTFTIEVELRPEFYGMSKNEMIIYLRQLNTNPLQIDLSLNKAHVVFGSM